MTDYIIVAKREVFYNYPIKADSKEQAIQKMYEIDFENYAEWAYDWTPLEVLEIVKDK